MITSHESIKEKQQQSALKSFISMSSVNERAAYEKHSIT